MKIEIRVALLHVPRFPTNYVTSHTRPVGHLQSRNHPDVIAPQTTLNLTFDIVVLQTRFEIWLRR